MKVEPVAVEELEVQEEAGVVGDLEAGTVTVARQLQANAGLSKSECPSGLPAAIERH